MSAITKVVVAVLALDQKAQALIGKGAHALAGKAYAKGDAVLAAAKSDSAATAAHLEALRKARITKLQARHKAELIALHEGIDSALDLNDARYQQELDAAQQRKRAAAGWHNTAARASINADKARKAVQQLEL